MTLGHTEKPVDGCWLRVKPRTEVKTHWFLRKCEWLELEISTILVLGTDIGIGPQDPGGPQLVKRLRLAAVKRCRRKSTVSKVMTQNPGGWAGSCCAV